jgi:tetratricopeptide (TPR) repeat protein
VTRAATSRAALAVLGLLVGLGCATRPPRSRAPSPDASVLEHVPVREFEDDNCGPGSLSIVLNALGDRVSEAELVAAIARAPGGGVLSVDLLLAARQRGFSASLVRGNEAMVRQEIAEGRPVILLLRLLDAPGRGKDIYHYVVVDGVDPRRDLLRFQFGDGKVRWTTLEPLEGAWKGAGYALLTVHPRGDGTDLREAVELERAEELDEAAERYRLILERRPDSVRAWVNLGNVRSQQGRTSEAERAYRRALDLAPDDVDAQNNLAWLLMENGADLDEAEALARRAAAQSGPDRSLALDTLGRILSARGRCDEADATFSEALKLTDLLLELRSGLERAQRETRESCRPAP